MKIFFLTALLVLPLITRAADMKGKFFITPIIGLESVQKFEPTTSMKTRAIYGLRATYKFPISALEAEYTHGQDSSSAVNSGVTTTYKDSEDKLRLGLRGEATVTTFSSAYIRGGAQYRKNEHTTTVGTAASTTSTSSKVQPYVGTGLNISVSQFFSLTADVLATYTPTTDPHLKSYELQPSLGIAVRF
jgi:hypothetical protein